MKNSTHQTQTLFGGQTVSVMHEDSSLSEVKVRQLRLADYEAAFRFLEDEIAFTAFCCSVGEPETPKTREWALTLQPESYEELQAVSRLVNAKGFFAYADRRKVREQQNQERLFAAAATMPPEMLAEAMRLGARSLESETQLPRPRPTPTSR